MEKDYLKIIMNPERQRICQALAAMGTATTAALSEQLPDIPKPSLYKHLKKLLDADMVQISGTQAKRGALEKTYSLTQPKGNPSIQEIEKMTVGGLMNLTGMFTSYFLTPGIDPVKDMLSLSIATLVLDDAEFEELLKTLASEIMAASGKPKTGDRKERVLSLVSLPVKTAGQGKGQEDE